MKKVEIIIEESVLDKVIDALNDADMLAQVEIDSEKGKNFKTKTDEKNWTTRSPKRYLSMICSNSQKEKIVQKIFPLINLFGGFCVTYDIL